MNREQVALVGCVVLALVVCGLAGGWYVTYTKATREFASSTAAYEEQIQATEREKEELHHALQEERDRNDAFADQINELGGTIGKLDKLSRTDPELLQKYSKVYFLNENYEPDAFEKIPTDLVYGEDDEYVSGQTWPFLKKLLAAAQKDDIDLRVISGYRSFNTQATLKASYRVTYGSGANAFSADQGYSEHQLGTTVDFTIQSIGSSFTGFDESEAYAWLEEHAYQYGFVLSYPKNNSYYQYEPWHWRFVGRELAKDLHEDGKYFYELDQRTIDTYLVNLFD